MNNIALTPGSGGPHEGDLVWSALPGAPVIAQPRRWRRFRDWLGRRRAPIVSVDPAVRLGAAEIPNPIARIA